MASLTAGPNLGTGSVSNLLRSSNSITSALAAYEDQIASLNYANSAYTDESFANYQSYLQGRINTLTSTGTLSNASKALTLQKTLEGAMKSNVSASITRENIQILAGNSTLQDKYNLIVSQFQRANANGDFTLAQTLEKQAYDVNQSIQYQAQQAADASASLARAGASSAKAAASANVTYQGEVATNLIAGLKYLNGLAKNTSEKEMNSKLAAYAKQAAPALTALGVKIQGNQPNYFDVVYGVAGAIYNAKVLQAKAEAPINPIRSQTLAIEAANYLNGVTKFDTLAGKMTVQEIQQAQADPNMLTYDNSTGKYVRDIQSGYKYMDFTDASGATTRQLVPAYSAFADTNAGRKAYNKVDFLSPVETTMMTKLGLNFTENKSGTTGNGVQISVTQNTPDWFKQVFGDKGIGNMFTDQNGFLSFKAGASNGQGDSYFTLTQDAKGLQGIFEHSPDGTTNLMGGDYGFNAGAVNLLVNRGEQVQQQVRVAQAEAQAKLVAQQAQAQQAHLSVSRPAPIAPAPAAPHTQAARLQPTIAPQMPTFNPQGNNFNPQGATGNPQSTVNGFNLNQSGSGGIRLR